MMARLYEVIGDASQAEKCQVQFDAMREAIHQVRNSPRADTMKMVSLKHHYWDNNMYSIRQFLQIFWNEVQGCWFDYDIVSGRHVDMYMDTNFFPLFTGCMHDGGLKRCVAKKLLASYL